MKLKILIMGLLMLGPALNCYPQSESYLVVSGQISNKDTGELLSFATIGIKHTPIGVVSNKLGEFSIHIPSRNINDSIIVSILGYHKVILPIKELSKNEKVQLEERIYKLEEVQITASHEKMSGKDIFKKVKKNQRSNLPDADYRLSAFFRETYQLNGEYFKLLEAAATIHGKTFPRSKKDVFIDEIRAAPGTNPNLPLSIGEDYNPFREFQGTTGRVSNVSACSTCDFEVEEYISYDEGLAVRITSKYVSKDSSRQSRFTYVVDMTNYAVLEYDFEAVIPFGKGFPETLDSAYHSSLIYLRRTSHYRKYNGKYYLSQYLQHLKHAYKAINNNETYSSQHKFHLMTNDVNIDLAEPSETIVEMNYRSSLKSNSKNYNEAFWKNYNVLKQTPLDEKIISDLEKNQPLDSQFKSGN